MQLMRLASVALVCLGGCDAIKNSPRPLAKMASLEVYGVASSPTIGSRKAIDPASNTPIFLTTPAIISATDVATVQLSEESSGSASLTVSLTPAGTKKLAAATSNPTGKQVAFVVNGEVIGAPKLHAQISDSFKISGDTRFAAAFESLTKP